MSQFAVDIIKCREAEDGLTSVGTKLQSCKERLSAVMRTLDSNGFFYVDDALRKASSSADVQRNKVLSLKSALDNAVSLYERTEKEIISGAVEPTQTESEATTASGLSEVCFAGLLAFLPTCVIGKDSSIIKRMVDIIRDLIEKWNYKVDSILFDDEGQYGGNQGTMEKDFMSNYERREQLLGYLREYYPDMSAAQAYAYLSTFAGIGCGYVAMANTILMQYENDPEGFYNTFGFPLYAENGDLNYDRMTLDIYAYAEQNGLIERNGDTGLPDGTDQYSRNAILQRYMGEKGVSVRTEFNAEVTMDNFRDISENGGKVIISLHEDNIYLGDEPHYISAHAMTVTGFTADGMIIVSSWGEEYYINVSDLDDNDSFSVIYYN